MRINKTIIIRAVFAIWIILWVNFILRDLFRKKYFYEYRTLLKRNQEGRRSHVYGDDFYSFLKFSKKKLPEGSTYRFIGVKDLSLAYRRAVYYLYPLIESDNPDYILVYNKAGFQKRGYEFLAELSHKKYILKKSQN